MNSVIEKALHIEAMYESVAFGLWIRHWLLLMSPSRRNYSLLGEEV